MTRFALRGLLGRKLRTALTALAIVLGVAMISGTYVLTDSIDQAFDRIFSDIRKGSNAVISGKSPFDFGEDTGADLPTFDERLVAEVRELPGVAEAEGGVDSETATLIGRRRGRRWSRRRSEPRLLDRRRGLALQAAHARRGNLAGAERGRDRQGDGRQGGLRGRGAGRRPGRGAGSSASGSRGHGVRQPGLTIGGATLAGFDLPTAQRLMKKEGSLDEIAVAAKPGVSEEELADQIDAILPPETQVRTAEAQAREDAEGTNEFITFLQAFLLAFAGVALFVGAFVIANSLSITIAQRTRELATVRMLGASRKQVLGSIIVEALVVGIAASVIGLFVGLLLARALFSLFDAVGFTLPNTGLVFLTRTVIVSLLVGILVTLFASLRPAIRATRVPRGRRARGATLPPGRFHRFRGVGAALLAVAGFAALLYGLFGSGLGTTAVLVWMGLGALLIFFGVALFSSRLVRPLAKALGWPAARFGGRRGAGPRQRAAQPAAHRLHRRRADDRARPRDARRDARRGHRARPSAARSTSCGRSRSPTTGSPRRTTSRPSRSRRRNRRPGARRRGRHERAHRQRPALRRGGRSRPRSIPLPARTSCSPGRTGRRTSSPISGATGPSSTTTTRRTTCSRSGAGSRCSSRPGSGRSSRSRGSSTRRRAARLSGA